MEPEDVVVRKESEVAQSGALSRDQNGFVGEMAAVRWLLSNKPLKLSIGRGRPLAA